MLDQKVPKETWALKETRYLASLVKYWETFVNLFSPRAWWDKRERWDPRVSLETTENRFT